MRLSTVRNKCDYQQSEINAINQQSEINAIINSPSAIINSPINAIINSPK